MDDEPGYWAVLRHADVVHVAKHSEIFSATEGGVVVETSTVALETMRDMLLAMDPPRHTAYRKPVAPEFKAVIAELDGRVREVVRGSSTTLTNPGPTSSSFTTSALTFRARSSARSWACQPRTGRDPCHGRTQ